MYVSIDPGISETGIAVFNEKHLLERAFLVRCAVPRSEPMSRRAFSICRGVTDSLGRMGLGPQHDGPALIGFAERPSVYLGGKASPASLVTLSVLVGQIIGYLGLDDVTYFEPRAWKGSVKKEASGERIESRLDLGERGRIADCPTSLRHNVIDAIGIGLHGLGRLGVVKKARTT